MKTDYVKAILTLIEEGENIEKILASTKKILDERGHTKLYLHILKQTLSALQSEQSKGLTVVVRDKSAYSAAQSVIEKEMKEHFSEELDYEISYNKNIVGGFLLKNKTHLRDQSYKQKLLTIYRNATH